jgi:hypothetical protein
MPATTSVVTTTSTLAEGGPLAVAEGAVDIRNVLVSGEEKAATVVYRDDPTTYQPPETGVTKVGRVRYRDDPATLDIYYPPSYTFDERLPAVVFINAWSTTQDTVLLFPNGTPMDEGLGTDDYQNSNSYISMGNAVAASGMIGVVYGTKDDPYQDLDDAMNWLTANAADLGIDQTKIAAWMWSAHTLTGLRVIMEEGDWQDDLAATVIYYGWMPYVDIRGDGPPIQLVRAMEDLDFFLESQDQFLAVAADVGLLVEVEEIQGPHSFNIEPGYEDLTIEAFTATLDYLEARFASSD